jgi:hypothetical protein
MRKRMTARTILWALVFWVAVACVLVVLFNFEPSWPRIRVMGFSMENVVMAGLVVAVWIVAIFFAIKKGKAGAKGD